MKKYTFSAIFLVALVSFSLNAHATRYYFWQSGFTGGGTLSGFFDATEANSDGVIFGGPPGIPNNQVSDFSMSVTGNSNFADFSSSFSDLVGLNYNINQGPFLGDNAPLTPVNLVEGLAVSHDTGSTLICYSAGFGATDNGGAFYLNNNLSDILDTTTLPVVVSLSPITQASYDATIPEPATWALLILGGLPLFRRIRR